MGLSLAAEFFAQSSGVGDSALGLQIDLTGEVSARFC